MIILFLSLVILLFNIILGIICIVYVMWLFSWIPDRKGHVPYVPTKSAIAPYVVPLLHLQSGSVVYDLGCGDGKMLFAFYNAYKDATYIGVEFHILPYLIARIRHAFFGFPRNMQFIYGNIFSVDISQATHIYLFLSFGMMKQIEPWLEHNLKKGTRIISCNFTFPERVPIEVVEPQGIRAKFSKGIYVYEI